MRKKFSFSFLWRLRRKHFWFLFPTHVTPSDAPSVHQLCEQTGLVQHRQLLGRRRQGKTGHETVDEHPSGTHICTSGRNQGDGRSWRYQFELFPKLKLTQYKK